MRHLFTGVCSFVALVWLAVLSPVGDAAEAGSFPYEARVLTAGAPVRSGPGENYYLTDSLAEGQTVEVYQERPDGWFAIRPPETSFSWVFSRHVTPVGDGLGRINKDDVPARVGSNLCSQRDVSQVQLPEGEVVRVIDEETHDGQSWYKIAPPAGEFRWIHASQIRREGAARDEASEADAAWRPMARENQPSPDMAANAGSDEVHLASSSSEEGQASDPDNSDPATTELPEEFGRRLDDLELRLSRMVAEPTATWDVKQLEGDAERLLSQAKSADERDAIQASLAKIEGFATIQRGYAAAGGTAVPAAQEVATTPIGNPNGPRAAGKRRAARRVGSTRTAR